MYKNLNSWSLGVSGRQSELIELALTYGFRGIEIDMRDLAKRVENQGLDRACRFLVSGAKAGLKVGGFDLPINWQSEENIFKADLIRLEKIMEIARHVGAQGCSTTVMPAHDKLPYHENFEFHRQRLGAIADVLRPYDVRLGLAFRAAAYHRADRPFEFIHQAEPVLTLIKTIGVPNVGLTLDTWNWWVGGGGMDQISELNPNQVVSVKLADLPVDAKLATIQDHQRGLPNASGTIDCKAVVVKLFKMGYQGPVAIVPTPGCMRGMTRDSIVQKTGQILEDYWITVGLSKPVRQAIPLPVAAAPAAAAPAAVEGASE